MLSVGLGLVRDRKGKFVVGLSLRLVSSRSMLGISWVQSWMRVGVWLGEWVYNRFMIGLGWI